MKPSTSAYFLTFFFFFCWDNVALNVWEWYYNEPLLLHAQAFVDSAGGLIAFSKSYLLLYFV